MSYSITIDGVDVTSEVSNQSPSIEDVINDQANTLKFTMFDRDDSGAPALAAEVIITQDGTKIFAGTIVGVKLTKIGKIFYEVDCVDYTALLDSNLVANSYIGMTDKEIIEDIVANYCTGLGITTNNVLEGVTIEQIVFNYLQPSECFRKICELTGRSWFIDYDKDVHYFPLTTTTAPFNVTADDNHYWGLSITKDSSQVKNRVYVRGGTYLSDTFVYEVKGDGAARVFNLPDKPHNLVFKINDVAKTVGIKNVNSGGFDAYLNFQEKYLELDAGITTPATTDTLRFEYNFDIPILVAVDDAESIAEFGTREFAIFDKTINTTQAARDRAAAELTDYANNLVEGTFKTMEPGFFSGQYLNVAVGAYQVSDNYLVQKVSAKSIGGGKYEYTISIASAKTIGIIKFLIKLLEENKNLVELNDDEVVDELFPLTDSLLADSLIDSLTIDSQGAYFTWAIDSLETTQTRGRWSLAQWGYNIDSA